MQNSGDVLSIQLLKTLIVVSESGSFSEAAKRVYISQAAVGQQMKRLEELVEAELFDRSTKPPVLNDRGRSIISRARDVVNSYENLFYELSDSSTFQGELNLGAVPSTIRSLIPLSMKQMLENYPGLHIRVVAGVTSELQEMVERGSLDTALLSKPDKLSSSLRWQTIAEEELVLLSSPALEEGEPEVLLSKFPFVRLAGQAYVRQMADDWLSANNIVVRPAMEMDSLETLSSMVAHNLGISIVPNFCVQDTIFASLRKSPLKKANKPRILGMVTRSDCVKLKFVNALVDELKRTVSSGAAPKNETRKILSCV